MPIPPEHTYTLRGESAHYHRVNGEDVLHRVRPTGSRPKVDGYDEEERTAHVHESGSDRHAAPRAVVRTAKRTGTAAWSLITAALFLLLPALYLLLQRSTVPPVPEPPLPAEEQVTEAYSNAYDDLRGTVPAAGADWDGDLTAGRRAGSARGHLHHPVCREQYIH